MDELTFKFKGKTYKLTDKWEETCLNDSKAFQLEQFKYLEKTGDFVTMENRVNNQLLFGYLEEISYIK
jgi:hypothetical protein